MPIKPIDKKNTKDPKARPNSKKASEGRIWWADKDSTIAARRLYNWACDIENVAWPRRFANLTFYRYMTGRPVNPTYNYSMVARPIAVNATYGRTLFRPPVFNAIAQCDDVLANRVYAQRPDVQVCPIAGDFSARIKAKKLTRWLDGAFYDLKIWNVVSDCAQDARIYGTGYLKVDVGFDGKPEITRIQDDEILVDETECSVSDNPRTIGIRVFVNRQDALDRFGDNAEAKGAIETAQSVSLGFYFGNDLDVSDVIVLVEGWHLGNSERPGRHILSCNGFALVDEKYKRDRFPIARLVYKRLPSGWRGQSLAEQLLPLQRALERFCAAMDENVQRMAYPKVGIPFGSNINPDSLAAKSGGWFKFADGAPPIFFNPEAITGDQFKYLETLIRMIRERVGISDQAASGMKPPGLNSGLAIERQSQIDDGRHKELSKALEDFVTDIGVLLIEAAEVCKPSVRLPGRKAQQIKWSDVKMASSSYFLRALPLSDLPNSIAGRTEIIEQWAAEGRISKATQNRLEQIPDIDGYLDIANAGQEAIEAALDKIVEEGTYEPPTPFVDLQDQLGEAQKRYLFELRQGDTPRDRLDQILQFIAATQELIDEAAPSPAPGPAPGAPGFGTQPPNVQAPVNQPYPVAPNVSIPTQ